MKEKIILKINEMALLLSEMVQLVYQGFMENDNHYLNTALDKERIMDNLEKEVTLAVVEGSRNLDERARTEYIALQQVAENIERMGDELRSLMERIEIKIAEDLFFSDLGVEQYLDVFERMRRSVTLTVAYVTAGRKENLEEVLRNGDGVKEAVERYRAEHLVRLTKGICEPRAANMYFDMLDFTGNIARHCTNIARTHKGL